VRSFLDWIAHAALPRQANDGFDARAGRFHEHMDLSG
jgi:hypothetical protein